MRSDAPILSVIVVSFNTRAMTLQCLEALYADLEGIPADVFVVDNASTDGSASAVRGAFPQVRLIQNGTNAGFGAANNLAMQEADGRYFLLLNSDAFPQKGALRQLIDVLQDTPRAAVAGPKLLNGDGSLQRSCYRFPSPFRAACENLLLTARWPDHPVIGDYRAWPHDVIRAVDFVSGACILVRRAAVEEVGGFDADFFLYAEEADWCYRFSRAGWNVIFAPKARVIHVGGGSGKPHSDEVFCEFHRGQERFMRKHHGIAGLWAYRSMMVVGACLRIGVFGISSLFRRCRREGARGLVVKWVRILTWTLGRRGRGLAKQ